MADLIWEGEIGDAFQVNIFLFLSFPSSYSISLLAYPLAIFPLPPSLYTHTHTYLYGSLTHPHDQLSKRGSGCTPGPAFLHL